MSATTTWYKLFVVGGGLDAFPVPEFSFNQDIPSVSELKIKRNDYKKDYWIVVFVDLSNNEKVMLEPRLNDKNPVKQGIFSAYIDSDETLWLGVENDD